MANTTSQMRDSLGDGAFGILGFIDGKMEEVVQEGVHHVEHGVSVLGCFVDWDLEVNIDYNNMKNNLLQRWLCSFQ